MKYFTFNVYWSEVANTINDKTAQGFEFVSMIASSNQSSGFGDILLLFRK